MKPSELRWYGWALVAVLLAAVIGLTIYNRPKKPLEPLPHELEHLRGPDEQKQAETLTKLNRRLHKHDSSAQALILQSAPGQPPVVAQNVADEDDEVEPTHWPAPWPAVTKAMAEPITKPKLLKGKYHGGDYRHRLIPLEEGGTRVLLINSTAERPTWFSLRNVLGASALFLAIALVLQGMTDQEDEPRPRKKK